MELKKREVYKMLCKSIRENEDEWDYDDMEQGVDFLVNKDIDISVCVERKFKYFSKISFMVHSINEENFIRFNIIQKIILYFKLKKFIPKPPKQNIITLHPSDKFLRREKLSKLNLD